MILGIDIGATKTQLGYINNNKLVKSEIIKTKRDPEVYLKELFNLIDGFLRDDIKNISKIGIGAPGPLEPLSGKFGKLPNLPEWEGLSIKDMLEEHFNLPVYVQNDANVATLGEAIFGGGKDQKSVCYITISTGIGAGFVIDKKIVEGKNNLAGEIWALNVYNMGQRDILLNACSGPGIVKNAQRLIENGANSSLMNLNKIEPSDVFKHAFNGDEVAKKVLENAWENMARATEMILLILDPDVILFGGGLCFDEKYMVEPIRKKVYERVILHPYRYTRIKRSDLWNEAVIYGAIELAESISD